MSGDAEAQAREIQKRFSETWTFDTRDLSRPDASQVLKSLIDSSPQETIPRLNQEFFGFGPLEPLLPDEKITEIIVNGSREVWFEREGVFQRTDDRFLTEATFANAVERICSESGVSLNLAEPFGDGRWHGFRLHVVRSPLVDRTFHLSLRRISSTPWTTERLLEAKWTTEVEMRKLLELLRARVNLVVIGPTGAGKTSVLAALLMSLPDGERAVILEDTDELPRPNSASSKLLTRTAAPALKEIPLSELVRQAMRMRPQRLVVGEVRGGEAKDLLLALATGHSGSLGTLHAADARQALLRLEMLVQMGAPQWNLQAVRQLIHLSLGAIVVCTNVNGHRRLEGLYKVAALESFGFLLERI